MNLKEVYFSKYCSLCKHKNVVETAEPCNECLTCGARKDSHKPEKFEGIEETKARKKRTRCGGKSVDCC